MSAQVLFSSKIAVTILHPPSTSPSALLSASAIPLTAHLTHSPSTRTLTLTLSDLSSRLLLLKHTLTPEAYITLRDDQSLRIDFAAFPAHLADLLSRPGPGFIAALIVPQDNDAVDCSLRLVELNEYKAITHVELPLRKADQSELTSALAARARDADTAQEAAEKLRTTLTATSEDLKQREADLSESQAENSSLRQRLALAEQQRDASLHAERELVLLRERLAERDARVEAMEHELSAANRERSRAVEETSSLHDRVRNAESGCKSAESAKRTIEGQLQSLKDDISTAGGEIRKGNTMIEKLQNEVLTLRAKGRVKTTLLGKQDRVVQELEARLSRLERETRRTRDRAAMLEVEKEGLVGQLSAARSKLEENAAVLASDQQVIAYLNRELNENVIGSRRVREGESGSRTEQVAPIASRSMAT